MNRLCKTLMVLQVAAGLSGLAIQARAADPAKPDVNRGQAIAVQVCASCHGADGNSAGGAYPKLAGQHPEYLVKQLKDFKTQPGAKQPARNNAIMAGMAAALSDQDMVNVAAYFATQTPKPGYAHNKDTVAARSEDLSGRHRGQGRAGMRKLPRADRSGHSVAVSASVGAVGRIHGGAVDRVHARPGRAQQQRGDARHCIASVGQRDQGCSRLHRGLALRSPHASATGPARPVQNKKRVRASCLRQPFTLFCCSVGV